MAATVMDEIVALDQSRPTSRASVTVVAAWYERKATLLARLAGDTRRPSEADEYATWAAAAARRATRLLAEVA
ncbi:MAG TPA: hypothetical protein VFW65_35175 [Pseudonocardiaceae bacterium]|nr:hypothetical protein [Pseudonocardiaceae bacterium]